MDIWEEVGDIVELHAEYKTRHREIEISTISARLMPARAMIMTLRSCFLCLF